jgi:hypothetical protein
VSDDSPQETFARLKKASDALDAAQDASHLTTDEIDRAQQAGGKAASVINGVYQPNRKVRTQRSEKVGPHVSPWHGAGNQSSKETMSKFQKTTEGTVALFNASDDTIDMIQGLLTEDGDKQTLIWCHFADLKKGIVDFGTYIEQHNPEVVIFDLSPPYDQNWTFFKTMRDATEMQGRGIVLTTTNKARLDEVLGEDSHALEVVGKPKDLAQINAAIKAETSKAKTARLQP